MKRTRICLILALIVLIGFTPSFPSVSGKNDKPKKAKEIEVLIHYPDITGFDPSTPVQGIVYNIYDGADVLIGSGITDITGMITISILASYNLSGQGIHIEFYWQGELIVIDNLLIGELNSFEILQFNSQLTFTYDGSTPLNVQDVEVWFNGVYITTITLVSGVLNMFMQHGIYTFKCIEFFDYEWSLAVYFPAYSTEETLTVSAQFKLVSSFLVW